MQVIGHHHPRIKPHVGIPLLQPFPAFPCDLSHVIQLHRFFFYRTEEAYVILHAERHKVSTGLGVVVPAQADGAAVILFGIVGHTC